jgi:hypothetical protein
VSFSDERGDRRDPRDEDSADEGSVSEKSSTVPGRSFGGTNIAADEASQARGRRESAATRDNMGLGPHDQEFSEGTRVSESSDAPIRTDAPPEEQAPRRAARDRERTEQPDE